MDFGPKCQGVTANAFAAGTWVSAPLQQVGYVPRPINGRTFQWYKSESIVR